jgi:hypothetical protein
MTAIEVDGAARVCASPCAHSDRVGDRLDAGGQFHGCHKEPASKQGFPLVFTALLPKI